MSETARDLGRRWFEEVWNRKRREAIPEMMAPECVVHDGEIDSTGPDEFYAFFERIHGSFSEIHVAVEHTIAEGDAACIRWSFTGQHTGGANGDSSHGEGRARNRHDHPARGRRPSDRSLAELGHARDDATDPK